jgi:large subunit ribosomal protein L24
MERAALQNTLLAIAIALIAAIVAAVIGPWLVDWNAYRPRIEAEASRLFGTPVRIGGDLSIRLLPTIRIDARDVAIGTETSGARIGRLHGELRVAPLLRGEASLNSVHIRDADVRLRLGQGPGRVLPIEALTVENARLSVSEEGGPATLLAERMMLSGESRGTAGPVRLEGSATVGETVLPLHLMMSLAEQGDLMLRLRVPERPEGPGLEAEGTIGAEGRPRFDGTLVMTGRSGRLPWRVSGQAAATAQSLIMQRAEAQVGSGDRIARATGSFRRGFEPGGAIEAVVSVRQADLDKLVEGPARTPRAVLATLLAEVPRLAEGAVPITLGFDIAGATLGGAPLGDLRGDMEAADGRWTVKAFSGRLPGEAQVEAAGDLTLTGETGFAGTLSVNAARPAVLLSWLDGQPTPPGTLDDPLTLTTRMTAEAGRLLLEDIIAQTAAGRTSGRVALDVPALGRHAFQAELTADALDLDLMLRIARGAGARLDPATDTRVQLRAAQARFAGFLARDVDLAVATDGRTFEAERLKVGDLAGFGLDLTGRLDGLGGPLLGRLSGRLRAADTDGLVALLLRDERTRSLAAWIRNRAPSLAGADLAVTFAASGRRALGLRIEGRVGEANLQIDAAGAGDPFEPAGLTGRVALAIDAPRADQIFALVAGAAAPAPTPVARTRLSAQVERPDPATLRLRGSLVSAGTTLSFDAGRGGDGSGRLTAALRSEDVSALMPLAGVPAEIAGRLPGSFDLAAVADGGGWRTEKAEGRLGGTTVTASLTGRGASARGEIGLGDLTGEAAMALLSGPAWLIDAGAGEFAAASFGETVLDHVDADVALRIARVGLGGYPALTGVTARLLRQGRVTSLRDLGATAGPARLAGGLTLDRSALRTLLSARFALTGVPAALALPGAKGDLAVSADLAADGATPAALVAGLNGSGELIFRTTALSGADPASLARVTRQAEIAQDLGRPMTDMAFGAALAQALEAAVPLGGGRAALGFVGLTARAGSTSFAVPGGSIGWTGSFDLAEGTMGAQVRIAPDPIPEAETMPVIAMRFDGPIGAPARTIDTDDVSGWLGLRLIDRAAFRIRMTESDRLERSRQRAFSRSTSVPPPQVVVAMPPMPPPVSAEMFLMPESPGPRVPAPEVPQDGAPVPAPRPAAPRTGPAPAPSAGADLPGVVRRALDGTRPAPPTATGAPLSILPPLPPPVEVGPAPGMRR